MASKFVQQYPVPQSFPEILKNLTREILRQQPSDVLHFAATYFQNYIQPPPSAAHVPTAVGQITRHSASHIQWQQLKLTVEKLYEEIFANTAMLEIQQVKKLVHKVSEKLNLRRVSDDQLNWRFKAMFLEGVNRIAKDDITKYIGQLYGV